MGMKRKNVVQAPVIDARTPTKKGSRPNAKKGKEEPAEDAKEDWLGGESDDEGGLSDIAGSSDGERKDDDGSGGSDDGDEEGEEEPGNEDDVASGDEEGGAGGQHGVRDKSKVLARIDAGENPSDLAAVKQRIHDDVTLLSSWRKSKMLGHGRSREEVFKTLVGNCSTFFGYSEELAEYFLQMFNAEDAVKFFEANEQHRPLTIRTNSLKARRQTLVQNLTSRKVTVEPIGDWTKVGLKVYDAAVPVGATPEYLGGQYMIQSASSFIPVMALAPQQNETVLDMAAAPGGKTTYVGQLMKNSGTLFANDLRADRCKALVANVHRMGLTNCVVTNLDGKKLQGMLPKLDRVLLDAPCSGSGIISRDPSVKVKRSQKDFEEHARLQKELLLCAIDMVDAGSKTGGYIVYSTCSIAVEENEAVIEHVLGVRNVEVVSFASAVNIGVEGFSKYRERRFHPSMAHTRRYLPHIHNMDGFFVAKLKKVSNDIPERQKKDRSKGADHVKMWDVKDPRTQDMMETVMDFDDDDAPASTGPKVPKASGKPLNKIDRKKLKRQQQLADREAASLKAAAIAAKAPAGAKARKAEEGPKAQRRAEKEAAPAEAAPQKKGKRKVEEPPTEVAEAAAPARLKKKRRSTA